MAVPLPEVEYRLPSVPLQFTENGIFDLTWTLTTVLDLDTPAKGPICLPLLRSLGAHGRTNIWQAGYDGVEYLYLKSGSYKLSSNSTELEGTVETIRTPVLMNTTSRTRYENAVIKLRKRYVDQVRKGYTTNIEEMGNAKKNLAMLATIYHDGTGDKPKTKLKAGLMWYGTAKLRGVRMIASFSSANEQLIVDCRSRQNKPFKHLTALKQSLLLLAPYLPAGFKPDGEAYVHGYNQQQIAKLVNVTATSPHPDEGKVIYFMFDAVSELPYDQRHAILDKALAAAKADNPAIDNLFLIPYFVINDANMFQLQAYRDGYIAQGFEGIVIRKGGEPYIHGRSVKMYKYKDREDDEGIIVGVDEWPKRPGSGFPRFEVKYGDNPKTFHVIMNGTEEYQRQLYRDRASLIGKEITFELEKNGITEDGIPKEGRGIAIRDYE
jgi:hypothetical protein